MTKTPHGTIYDTLLGRDALDKEARKLSPEAVTWAYRLFLDREPENDDIIESKLMFLETTQELRAHLMGCVEFQEKNSTPLIPGKIDVGCWHHKRIGQRRIRFGGRRTRKTTT